MGKLNSLVALGIALLVATVMMNDHRVMEGAAPLLVVSGVVFGSVYGAMQLAMRWQRHKIELKSHTTTAEAAPNLDQIKSVHAELAQLRDTSTQFDVSLQHALERIEHRLDHLERHSFGSAESRPETTVKQSVGR